MFFSIKMSHAIHTLLRGRYCNTETLQRNNGEGRSVLRQEMSVNFTDEPPVLRGSVSCLCVWSQFFRLSTVNTQESLCLTLPLCFSSTLQNTSIIISTDRLPLFPPSFPTCLLFTSPLLFLVHLNKDYLFLL